MKSERPSLRVAVVAICIGATVAACSNPGSARSSAAATATIRLYTSVTQDTVDAVLQAFAVTRPDIGIDLYRAPTGEIDARIAAERRTGGISADVLWATDPISVEQYDADGLLRDWSPSNADAVPAGYRGASFWGTRILNVVIVARTDLATPPADWSDLADPAFRGGIALADPGFAGSALGVVAYFALSDGYGLDYLRALAANGATQVQSIGDVINGVAEGQFAAGLSLDKSVRDAADAGSPVELVWPASGAIAIFSPIAIFAGTRQAAAAESFVDFVLGADAQAAIAATGWQPVRSDVAWDRSEGPQVQPDWEAAFARRDELLNDDRSIFGG